MKCILKNILLNYMNQKFFTYWGGYFNSPLTLDKTVPFADTVILAFGGPLNNALETTFLCSKYNSTQIIDWCRTLQERGQKVRFIGE